ncbi:uncharacterized protein RJT20DRAFT_41732 [Scheffersomyces xylosifermentans]|uniref:uncharacterized protein n=1 Tax=Scheffersomyces xylosifermentans TaxID=1304137 RepID=UPI00315C8244
MMLSRAVRGNIGRSVSAVSSLRAFNGYSFRHNSTGGAGKPSGNEESGEQKQASGIIGTVKAKIQDTDKLFRKIGDDKTQESVVVIKYFRRIGVFSILVVLGAIGYASQKVVPQEEVIEIDDLRQDIRNFGAETKDK